MANAKPTDCFGSPNNPNCLEPLGFHRHAETCLAACSADAALRRSIPAFNKDVREVQGKLEDVAFKLRIPQRKPWPAMVDDVKAASSIVSQADQVSLLCLHACGISAI